MMKPSETTVKETLFPDNGSSAEAVYPPNEICWLAIQLKLIKLDYFKTNI